MMAGGFYPNRTVLPHGFVAEWRLLLCIPKRARTIIEKEPDQPYLM